VKNSILQSRLEAKSLERNGQALSLKNTYCFYCLNKKIEDDNGNISFECLGKSDLCDCAKAYGKGEFEIAQEWAHESTKGSKERKGKHQGMDEGDERVLNAKSSGAVQRVGFSNASPKKLTYTARGCRHKRN